MSFTIFSDPSAFNSLSVEWHALLQANGQTNPFLTPEFSQVWWQTFGSGQLAIGVSRAKDRKLQAILPMYQPEPERWLSLASKEVTDYFDWIVAPGAEAQVSTELKTFLNAKKSLIRNVELLSLAANSSTRDLVKQLGWTAAETQQDVCPVISLPATWDEYLSQIGKKQRHEIKRKIKNLEATVHPEVEAVTKAEQLGAAIPDFIQLHKSSSPDKASFWNHQTEAYFGQSLQAAAQKGWLKLYFLKIDQRRAAAMICFDDGQTFYLYNSGFNPDQFRGLSVGNVLTAHTIKAAIEAGRQHYDFLRGDEEYKFRFGAQAQAVFDLQLTK